VPRIRCRARRHWITAAWALLATVLLHAGVRQASAGLGLRLFAYGVYVLALIRLIALDVAEVLHAPDVVTPALNARFAVAALAVATLVLSARLLHRHRGELPPPERTLVTVLAVGAPLVLLYRISIEAGAAFRAREIATAAPGSLRVPLLLTLSIIWAVYAALLIGAGMASRFRPLRLLGVSVLALVVLKVFAVDMQVLGGGYRIASFAGVGVMLLLISVLYQRGRRR